MTSSIFPAMLILALMSIVVSSTKSSPPFPFGSRKETQLTFYSHNKIGGPNSTNVPIVGLPGKAWGANKFGTFYVVDSPLTEGPSLQSRDVGRAQGIQVTTSLDGSNAMSIGAIKFTGKKFNGSTLAIQTISGRASSATELAVVSGTGKFRFARGYAICKTHSLDKKRSYVIARCDYKVRHY